MDPIETQLLPPSPEGLHRAALLLRGGGLVAFPTETVYGLGADARDDGAVDGIFLAKARPGFNPLIVHVADLEMAQALAEFDDIALRLASAFWPGPLTLVLPRRAGAVLAPAVTAGLGTVGLRVPAHPVARALIEAFGGPLAGPSANPSGRVSPTRPDHVLAGLSGRIDAVVDGGECNVGVESTIIGIENGQALLLRPGGIPQEAIEACLGGPLSRGGNADAPTAPGQLNSHYAPSATLRLNAETAEEGEVWLGFGPLGGQFNLSRNADLAEAASRLYHLLRAADTAAGPGGIAVAPVPDRGLGRAINDRLRRAAAPRGNDVSPPADLG